MISSNATTEEGKYLSISAQWDCHDYDKLSVDAIFQRAKLAFVTDVKKAQNDVLWNTVNPKDIKKLSTR